ncbi:LOW QUALITY PROTEIN: adenosine receptor A3 [Aplochiton taeniatus]
MCHSTVTPNASTVSTSSYSSSWPPCTFLSVAFLPFMVYLNFLGPVPAPILIMNFLYAWVFRSLQGDDSSPQARAPLLRERRLACSLVLALFADCWLPLYLVNCVLLFCGPRMALRSQVPLFPFKSVRINLLTPIDQQISYQLENVRCIVLSHATSAVNPVVYPASRIPKIRQAYSPPETLAAMATALLWR